MKILVVERLEELMKERHLNQVQLAAETSIKQNTLSRWLSGQNEPNVASLWLLADYFNVSVDYLIGRKEY